VTVALFRWKAIVPLALFLAVLVALWLLFADRLGRLAVERGGTSILGARVDVRSFHLSLGRGSATLRGLVVASPFDSLENLFEADELTSDIDPLPLLEKKVAIDRLAATGLRFGTARTTSGFVSSSGPGATSQIMANVKSWAAQPALQVPVLQLAEGKLKVDSLDPRKLQTVQAAESLAARADSSRRAWTTAFDSLDVRATTDSATAFAQRLQGAHATDLALLRDARRMLDRVKQTRDRLAALDRGVKRGVDVLDQGMAALQTARQQDYAFAKNLIRLPPIDATAIAWVLFGPEAVRKFQRALYYTQLARTYMPPGLLPRAHPGPRRLRRAGTTVEFPRANRPPGFLLRDAELSFILGTDSAGARSYAGRLQGLTSAPALYGRPTTFEVRAPAVSADGQLDHVHATARDFVGGSVHGVALPAIALPGLLLRVTPGRGDVTLAFGLYGDSLRGRWTVSAPAATWQKDSGSAPGLAADLVWRAVSEITNLDLTAELGGTLSHPELHVRSNLDQAVSDRIRSMIGAEVDAAQSRLRVDVDRFADERITPLKAQVAQVTTEANARVQQGRQALDAAQQRLEQQLRRLTGGIRLP
jgi:uncharacterized protein (TIGR03545 family)